MAKRTPRMQAHKGHAEHTKESQGERGLAGRMPRPIKIVLLGAGSFFTQHLVNDFFQISGLGRIEIALVDIDRKRLDAVTKVCRLYAQKFGQPAQCITATTDRLKALPGAHYIVCCVEVSGVECVRHDNNIPLKYGVDQCIGDTIGPGGLFKGLRTIPVWIDILRDCERHCPDAVVLNYTNPMSMMCLAAGRTSNMSVVGLCHSVQGTSDLLARRAGIPYEQLEWECAGINHLAWFTKLRHKGKDLYPKLKKMAEQDIAGKPADPEDEWDLVRKEMMIQFGAFITESSGHLSEYLPYFRKRKDLLKKYARDNYHGQSSFYADNWPTWRKDADKARAKLLSEKKIPDSGRSWEYAGWIIESMEKDQPRRIHGNVMNKPQRPGRGQHGGPLIENLPHDGVVEVACHIDRNGIQPMVYGRLPRQMAAICASNMAMVDLAAQAAIEKSRELAVHALMLDPLTSAVCGLREIRKMADEMFKAERKYLSQYK